MRQLSPMRMPSSASTGTVLCPSPIDGMSVKRVGRLSHCWPLCARASVTRQQFGLKSRPSAAARSAVLPNTSPWLSGPAL